MFWEKFCSLCESKEKKPNRVCSELDLSSATATKWKNGTLPNAETLIKIADYFDVSVDYLLDHVDSADGTTFWHRFQELYESRRMKLSEVAELLGIDLSEIERWRNGCAPSFDDINRISRHFNTTSDYLLGISTFKTLPCVVDLAEIFNPSDNKALYMSHLWETQINVYYISRIFIEFWSQKRYADFIPVFKYVTIVLYEALFLLNINIEDDKKLNEKFSSVIADLKEILNKSKMEDSYKNVEKIYEKNKNFFKDVRNLAAHFDHERSKFFTNTVNDLYDYELEVSNNGITDESNPLFLKLMKNVYKENYPNQNLSDDDLLDEIFKLYAQLLESVSKTLNKLVNLYFDSDEIMNHVHMNPNLNSKNSPQKNMAANPVQTKKASMIEDEGIKLYNRLDAIDKVKVQGYIESMLEAEKYRQDDAKMA